MAAAVQQRQDGDIDRFIKDQRQKLQQERHVGGEGESDRGGRRRQWDKSETNQYAEQNEKEDTSGNALTPRDPTPELSSQLGQYDQVRKQLNAERQQEYNDLLQKKASNVGKQNSQSPRDLYDYDEVKKHMMQSKRQEYQDYLSKGRAGPSGGRLKWEKTGQTSLPAHQGNKPAVDFEEWDKDFQDDKRKDYNKFLRKQQNHGRVLKKEPTPPFEGMKFGEFEEYKRQTEDERRKQYKKDLEKQKREQALIKLKRDYPNQPVATISPRHGDGTERQQYRSQIEESKQKQFSKMLAQQPTVRDVRPQPTQGQRRSQSPEFSDPGMQLEADRIRTRIKDLPTRPEEVEELQRKQQQQDSLQRQLDEVTPRYDDRRHPRDLNPRRDDYGPGPSDRYIPPDDPRQPPPHANIPGPAQGQKSHHRADVYDGYVMRHHEAQIHQMEEDRRRRRADVEDNQSIYKQLEAVKRRQELEEKRRIKERLQAETEKQLQEELQKEAEERKLVLEEQDYHDEMLRQIKDQRLRDEEQKKLAQVKYKDEVRKQIAERKQQVTQERKRVLQEQQQDVGMLQQLDQGRRREVEERKKKQDNEEEKYREVEEERRSFEEGGTVHRVRERIPLEEDYTYAYDDREMESRGGKFGTEESSEEVGEGMVVEEIQNDYNEVIDEEQKLKSTKDGVSLPISSHEQRQTQLKEERNREYNAILAQASQQNNVDLSGEGTSLRISGHEQRRKAMAEERNKEYNDIMAQASQQKADKVDLSGDGTSLHISAHKQRRKAMVEERNKEYNEIMAQASQQKASKVVLGEGTSLRISGHEQRRKAMVEERKKEYNEIMTQASQQKANKVVLGEGTSLRISAHEQRRKAMVEERKKEYNEIMTQASPQKADKVVLGEGTSLRISGHEQRRKAMVEERKKEYNEIMAQASQQKANKVVLGEGTSLHISAHEQRRKAMVEERKKEYNDIIDQETQKKRHNSGPAWDGVSLPISSHRQRNTQMEDERKREYNEIVAQKDSSRKTGGSPLVGEGVSLHLSGHESHRKQLKEEIKKEYNEMLSQRGVVGPKQVGKDGLTGEAVSLPISEHQDRRLQMLEERRHQYNEMLAQINAQGQTNNRGDLEGREISLALSDHGDRRKQLQQERTQEYIDMVSKQKAEPSIRVSLEGEAISLPISGHSTQRRKLMEERSREYNKMLRQQNIKQSKKRGSVPESPPGVPIQDSEDSTQQYDSEGNKEDKTVLPRTHHQRDGRKSEPDPYPRELARPELLANMPHGQYEFERERVDFDRQRQNEQMLSKNDVVERMRFINQLEENRIALNRLCHHGNDKQTMSEDDTTVHLPSPSNDTPGPVEGIVTPDNEVDEGDQKQNTGRRMNREKQEGRPITPGGLMGKMGREQQDRTSKLNEQRKKEYNQLLTDQATAIRDITKSFADVLESERSEKGERPRPPASEPGTRYIEDPRYVRGRPPRPDNSTPPRTQARFEESQQETFTGVVPGLSGNEEMQKARERNDEYNEFLRNKEEKQRANSEGRRPPLPRERPRSRHGRNTPVPQEDGQGRDVEAGTAPSQKRGKPKQPDDKFEASLPGMRTNSSQRRRKEDERNREYNEMLRKQRGRGRGRGGVRDMPPETRRGWQTPTYEEILDKKRQEERQYRRQEDPYGDSRGMRPYASEGAMNRIGVDDVKMRDLDREYEQRRVRFHNERSKEGGVLEDDNWLRTNEAKEQQYSKLGYVDSRSDSELDEGYRFGRGDREEEEPQINPRRKDMSRPPGDFFATLPLGRSGGVQRPGNERDSATRRKKQKYRDELQLQMQETKAAKFREKNEDMMVAASGFLDPEKTPVRVRNLGQPDITPRRRGRSPEVQRYHSKIIQQQQATRGGGYDPSGDYGLGGGVSFGADASAPKGRRRERAEYDVPSILDGGFDTNLLEPRRPAGLQLPPGLQYQPTFAELDPDTGVPSTYITGQDQLGGFNNLGGIDDAYRFYGMRNPLDPEPAGGGGSIVPPLNLSGDPQRRASPRVTFDESPSARGILKDTISARRRHRSPGRTTPYQFDADQVDQGTNNMNKREYANELSRQIELDKLKKARARQENIMYEKRIEEDMLNYNPFGRAGGGAPNIDGKGQPIADLRQMRRTNDDSARSPPPRESPRFRAPYLPRMTSYPTPGPDQRRGENTYALGGHGIFGNPRTEEEKSKADKYKDDLRLQILEKKRHEQLKKEQEKIEEEKENRRLEEQRQRIQRDFDEEQRKKRDKEEENRRKQEELVRKNEEKRREAERAKREKAEVRQRERERELDDQARYDSHNRAAASPPVPALRSKIATTDGEPEGDIQTTLVVPPTQPPSRAESQGSTAYYAHYRAESAYFTPIPPPSATRPPVVTGDDDPGTTSPPIPTQRSQPEPQQQAKSHAPPPPEPLQRPNSSDVLRELANMRQQLESERRRVEGALNKQKNEPEVFDPRLVQRPPPKEVDVFERATQGNASVPQRVSDNANPKNVQEFQDLKYKAAPTSEASNESKAAPPDGDTESRRAFRSMFPDQPYTNTKLESQQDAMLRQQSEQIRTLKDKSYVPPSDLGMAARQGTGTPRSLLQANTAFIDVENMNHFPEDFDDMPRRNDSARMRRRESRITPLHDLAGPSNMMGSVSSLDVDKLQRKNDARMRRLKQMNADEVSMADPDEILENFMAKQRYNRPPSGQTIQTLQDDTWLQPGNKQL